MNDSNMEVSYQINRQKIIFTGDIAVGKTSIINVLMGQKFTTEYEASIGVDFFSKTIKYKGKIIKLQIWDSAGQEKFRSLIPNYIRGASLVFIVYDITNRKSFENLPKWIEFVNNIENSNIVIVGNKSDIKDERQITLEEGEKFSQERNVEFFEVSAKEGTNLDKMLFNSVASLPFFLSINSEGYTKEQIVEALEKENLEQYKYENTKQITTQNDKKELNVVADSSNGGEISLKENENKMDTHINVDEIPIIFKRKKCC